MVAPGLRNGPIIRLHFTSSADGGPQMLRCEKRRSPKDAGLQGSPNFLGAGPMIARPPQKNAWLLLEIEEHSLMHKFGLRRHIYSRRLSG